MKEELPTRVYPKKEATANPIFLLQSRRWVLINVPNGWEWDGDGHLMDEETGTCISSYDEIAEITSEGMVEWWETECVFLTREEANEYGESRHYRWPDGWRVYCMPAEGELAKLLKMITIEQVD